MKYIKLGWPEIQAYMDNEDYPTDCYYDPQKDAWFIPESWIENELDCSFKQYKQYVQG